MDNDDEYRRNAAEAQRWADRAKSDLDRASWLRVAQGWLSLIRSRPQSAEEKTEEEAFDAKVKARGTGQESSEGSH
jgi:hypothetical protein